jgi:hypothetical protein
VQPHRVLSALLQWFSSQALCCTAPRLSCDHAPGAQPTDALRRERFESSLLCGALRVVDIGAGPQGTRATHTMAATRGCSSLPRWLSSCTVHQASARFRLPFLKLHYCAYLCALCGCFVAASIEGAPHATEHRAHTAQCAWHHRSAQRTRLCCAVLCCAVLCCAVLCCAVLFSTLQPAVLT